MTPRNQIIIAKGKDITFKVKFWERSGYRYDITFIDGRKYSYSPQNVLILTEFKTLDSRLYTICCNGRELFGITEIKVYPFYSKEIWQISFGNGMVRNYAKSELLIKKSVLDDKTSADCLHYLHRTAELNDLTDETGKKILAAQYRKIEKVNDTTVLSRYLNPANDEFTDDAPKKEDNKEKLLIFPFGCNASQYQAVQNALTNRVSVIEGPPGTGKTQTILNLIANLVIEGKRAQVVSNNNAATDNILEKMSEEEYGIGFLAARLGSRSNKEAFVQGQTGEYPDMTTWEYKGTEDLSERLKILSAELDGIYRRQRELEKAQEDLDRIDTEFKHFILYLKEEGYDLKPFKVRKTSNPKKIMKLIRRCEDDEKIGLRTKLKGRLYGIGNLKLYKAKDAVILNAFRYAFYITQINCVKKAIDAADDFLRSNHAESKAAELKDLSLELLKDNLSRKYSDKSQRTIFDDETIFRQPASFLNEYPIILGTTFSALSSVNCEFDYVIIDESSQVDISTGALALCSAKNAVVVGDSCQLPFVLSDTKKRIASAIFSEYMIGDAYDFSKYSFLDSVKRVFPDAPVTLLREHYRCDPAIIGFCNDKFYNGSLLIMSERDGNNTALSAFRTVAGDHAKGKYNQRQIDVITDEILPKLEYDPKDVGIIAPYNDQIDKLIEIINDERILISTVHKFQGREKKVIIFCTVDNNINEFIDDPKLLNVAVSRAEKSFILVTNNENGDGNIADLLSYIEYHNFEIHDSKLYSVFDLLYSAYDEERIAFLSKHRKISQYDSENLMYSLLWDMLEDHPEYSVACHVPLRMIIRDRETLEKREYEYVTNPYTHVDFLIYNKVSKKNVLIIEVDGFSFHKKGTKQYERDRIKDAELERYDIPFVRLPTTGKKEWETIRNKLAL